MKADWLCKIGGQQCGPFSVEQLRQLASAGTIDATTEVRRQIDQRWFPAGKIAGLLPAAGRVDVPHTKAQVAPSANAAGARPLKRAALLAPTVPAAPAPAGAKPVQATPARPPVVRAAPVGAAPMGVPVGAPVTSSDAATPFQFNAAAAAKATTARTTSPTPTASRRKSQRTLIMVAALGGVGLALLLGGGVLIALNAGVGESPDVVADAFDGDRSEDSSREPLLPESEANPTAAREEDSAEGEAAPASAPAASAPVQDAASRGPGAVSAELATISAWNSLAKYRGSTLKGVGKFEVVSVTVSDSPTRTSTTGAGVVSSPASEPAENGASATAKAPPKFLLVEVKITNIGTSPLSYAGWNQPAQTAATLLDAAGSPLEFVPISETPGLERIVSKSVVPGGHVTDTLVFRVPTVGPDALRLALPKPALSSLVKGYFAIEIPPQSITQRPAEPAAPALASGMVAEAGDAAAREFAALQKDLMEAETADAAAPAGAVPANPQEMPAEASGEANPAGGKPPSTEDLDKLFREGDDEKSNEATQDAAATAGGKSKPTATGK